MWTLFTIAIYLMLVDAAAMLLYIICWIIQGVRIGANTPDIYEMTDRMEAVTKQLEKEYDMKKYYQVGFKDFNWEESFGLINLIRELRSVGCCLELVKVSGDDIEKNPLSSTEFSKRVSDMVEELYRD